MVRRDPTLDTVFLPSGWPMVIDYVFLVLHNVLDDNLKSTIRCGMVLNYG